MVPSSSGTVQVGEVSECLSGGLRGWVLVQGDEALLVLGDDPVPDGDRLVEGVGELGLLGGLDDQQAGVEAVLIHVADAVVAPALQSDLMQ
jgi:hypothetical protein